MSPKCILIFCLISCLSLCENLFPKKIWLYWDEPIEKAPYIVRLCYENFVKVSQEQKWQLTLVNYSTLPQYIEDYQTRVQEVVKNAKLPLKANFADLIRLLILEDHGGVYFDISSIPLYGLQWIQNLQQHPYLLTNRKKGQKPDLLAPYTNYFQSTSQSRGQQQTIINLQPGFEVWFIAARAKSPAIKSWRESYSHFYQHTLEENLQQYDQEDIFYRGLQTNSYFTANKAISYFLQRKQFLIDKNIGLFTQRETAVNFYKVWGFHAEYGPIRFIQSQDDFKIQFYQKSIQELNSDSHYIKFYVKITNDLRQFIKIYFDFQIQLAKNGSTFQKLIQEGPTLEECLNFVFPVQGSIIANLIQKNPLAQKLKLFHITKQQNVRWKSQCQKKRQQSPSSLSSMRYQKIILQLGSRYLKSPLINTLARKLQPLLYEEKSLTLQYRLWIHYKHNEAVLKILSLFIVGIILSVKIFSKLMKIMLKLMRKLDNVHSAGSYEKLCEQTVETQPKYDRMNSKYYMVYFYILFSTYNIVMVYYELYDKCGDVHSDKRLFFFVVWTFFLKYLTRKNIHDEATVFLGFKMKEFNMAFDPVISYQLGKQVLNWTQVRPNHLFPHAIIICLIYPCLLKIGDNLRSQSTNFLLKAMLNFKNYHSFTLLVFILACLSTNLRYMTFQNRYFVRSLPIYLTYYVFSFLILIIVQTLVKTYQFLTNYNKSDQKSSQDKLYKKIVSISLYLVGLVSMWNFCYWIRFDLKTTDIQIKMKLQVATIFYFVFLSLSMTQSYKGNVQDIKVRKGRNVMFLFKTYFVHLVLLFLAFILNYCQPQIVDRFFQLAVFFIINLFLFVTLARYHDSNSQTDRYTTNYDFHEFSSEETEMELQSERRAIK